MQATSYFFAVIGLGHKSGLGAGIAEVIDSSFFPIVYVGWVWLIGRGCRGDRDLPGVPTMLTCIAGASLTIVIYWAAIRIESDLVQAAAMGLVPLFAVAFEIAGCELSLLPRHVRIDHLGFWVGAAMVASGIVPVRRGSYFKTSQRTI